MLFKFIKKDTAYLSLLIISFIPICYLFFYYLFMPTESLSEYIPILVYITTIFTILWIVSIFLTYLSLSKGILPISIHKLTLTFAIVIVFVSLSLLLIALYPKVHEK
jgi:hypothetical protein